MIRAAFFSCLVGCDMLSDALPVVARSAVQMLRYKIPPGIPFLEMLWGGNAGAERCKAEVKRDALSLMHGRRRNRDSRHKQYKQQCLAHITNS